MSMQAIIILARTIYTSRGSYIMYQAACPEIYLLNASLTEGGLGSLSNSPLSDLHSTHHCSPQLTSSQFSNTHLAPLTLPAPLSHHSPHTTSGSTVFLTLYLFILHTAHCAQMMEIYCFRGLKMIGGAHPLY